MEFYPLIIVALSEADGGGFISIAPDLLGCLSDGETPEEALANGQEAVREWLATAQRRGMEIPAPCSAAAEERREKDGLIAHFKEVVQSFDHLESRLDELERVMVEFEESRQNEVAWARLVKLTSVPVGCETKGNPAH